MRVALQRVAEASVEVVEEDSVRETGRIGEGLVALIGFAASDGPEAIDWMSRKIADLRVFPGPGGELDRSLRETAWGLLLVSQFTLYADVRKGRRPDFAAAAPFPEAERLYGALVARCRELLPGPVETGVFGARMRVRLVNEGPVTLIVER